MLHEFLQYQLGEEAIGRSVFMHVAANVPYVFISENIQVLAL